MPSNASVPMSILDLAFIGRGETARDSLEGSVRLAQLAEASGYRRVWYAEHHNMSSIASSATSVLTAHVAACSNSCLICCFRFIICAIVKSFATTRCPVNAFCVVLIAQICR